MILADIGFSSKVLKGIPKEFKNSSEYVDILANSVKALTARQQALVLSSNGVSDAMIREVLETNEVTKSEIDAIMAKRAMTATQASLTKSQLAEIITVQTGNAEKTTAIMTELGLVSAKNEDVIATEMLSASTVKAALAQQGLNAEQTQAILLNMGLAKKTDKISNFFSGLATTIGDGAKALFSFIKVHPVAIAVTAAIATTVGVISHQIKENEQQIKQAIETAEELKESVHTVDEYVSKIKDLRESLDSGNNSFDEQKNIRAELLSIQEEMVSKYGDEIRQLDLMTDSVINLENAIEGYSSRQEAQDWLINNAEAVEKADNTVQAFGVDYIDNLKNGINEIKALKTQSVDDFNVAVWNLGVQLGKDFSEYIVKTKDEIKTKQDELIDTLQANYNALTGENSGLKLIPEWMEKGSNYWANLLGDMDILGSVDEDIEIFKQSGYYKLIADMPEMYDRLTNAVKNYNDAVTSGDTSKQRTVLEELEDIFNDSKNIDDNAIKWYIQNELSSYIGVADKLDEELQQRLARFNTSLSIAQSLHTRDEYGSGLFKIGEDEQGGYTFKPNDTFVEIIPKLNDSEFETLLKLVQGEIGENIDWLTYQPESLTSLVKAMASTADGFDVTSWYESNEVKDITDSLGKLQSAYASLEKGESIDLDDLIESYPELAKYTDNVEELKKHIRELANSKVTPLIENLQSLINGAIANGDNETVKVIQNVIDLLYNEADVTAKVKDESSKTNDVYKTQKEILKQQLSYIKNNINKEEERKEAAQKTLDTLEEQKDSLEKTLDKYDTAVSTITSYIDEQIDSLEEQKTAIEDTYSQQIEALESEAEEREKVNDLIEKQIALEKAKETQVRVYDKERGGFRIETDKSIVAQAQKEYDDAVRESEIDRLEKERDNALKPYDDEIKSLENYKNSWEQAAKSYQKMQDEMTTAAVFGSDWRNMVISQDTNAIQGFVDNYSITANRLHNIVEPQIEQTKNEIDTIDKQISKWKELQTQQQSYLDFFKNYGTQMSQAIGEQAEAVKDFVNAINGIAKSNGVVADKIWDLVQKFYVPDYIPAFANGGVSSSTGLAMLHGTKQKSEVTFNAEDAKKLYDMIHGRSSAQLTNTVARNIVDSAIQTTRENASIVNNNRPTNNEYTWVINEPKFSSADDYRAFSEHMDRYVREANMNRLVGKK